jgi:hypothetical protein
MCTIYKLCASEVRVEAMKVKEQCLEDLAEVLFPEDHYLSCIEHDEFLILDIQNDPCFQHCEKTLIENATFKHYTGTSAYGDVYLVDVYSTGIDQPNHVRNTSHPDTHNWKGFEF